MEANIENVDLVKSAKAFGYLRNIFLIHKSFVSILALQDNPALAKENNINGAAIMESVVDKFKVAILNTKQFNDIISKFLK